MIKAITSITDMYVRDIFLFVPAPLAERGMMLIVTPLAKEKLKKALLEEQETDPEVIFRITPVHSMPDRLGIALDKENKNDQVVTCEEGTKVLLVEFHLAHELEGMVLDYIITSQGEGFKISKLSPVDARQRGKHTLWN
jgi:Fe-S cluster assembly iron-binding protein IscA